MGLGIGIDCEVCGNQLMVHENNVEKRAGGKYNLCQGCRYGILGVNDFSPKEAQVFELKLLKKHLDRQVVEKTITTSSLILYIKERILYLGGDPK